MSATFVIITNATSNQLSLVGDAGATRFDISASAGGNTININMTDLLGNSLLCSTLSTWVTAGYVTITRGGTAVTAAMLTAWIQGSDMSRNEYDTDDDNVVDAAEAVSDGTTTITATDLMAAQVHVQAESFTHADLTASAGTETLTFAASLPATAIVLGVYVDVTEAFDNAGATATTTCDVGTGASDAFLDAAAIGAVAVVGAPIGDAPAGPYPGVDVTVVVDSDVNVDTLTTGIMSVRVIYVEAAEAIIP